MAAVERKQTDRLRAVRARRNGAEVARCLADIRAIATGDHNLMPGLIAAARAHVTEGEIVDALQSVWGSYSESPVF